MREIDLIQYSISPQDITNFCTSQMVILNAICSQVKCACVESQCPLWLFRLHMQQNRQKTPDTTDRIDAIRKRIEALPEDVDVWDRQEALDDIEKIEDDIKSLERNLNQLEHERADAAALADEALRDDEDLSPVERAAAEGERKKELLNGQKKNNSQGLF